MARILAIDFGTVRTGVAVTDELQLIASALTTVPTFELLAFLKDYVKNEKVVAIVVGEPKQMDGTASESESDIRSFMEQLRTVLPEIEVIRQDERFTSKLAVQAMLESGLKKKARQNKALVDEISATLILQAYLDRKQL